MNKYSSYNNSIIIVYLISKAILFKIYNILLVSGHNIEKDYLFILYLERATASVGLLKNEKLNVAPQITVNVFSAVNTLKQELPTPTLTV